MEKNIEKTIFNLQRFQILQTKLNPATSNCIPDFYAYAWYVRLYPLLEQNDLHENLKNSFVVTPKQVDIVTERADSEWLKGKTYTFYEYENYFEVRSTPKEGLDRYSLIAIFRYSYLRGGFDEPFWDKLLEPMNHPSEASIITRKFAPDEIYLV